MREVLNHRVNEFNQSLRIEVANDPIKGKAPDYKYQIYVRQHGSWEKATRVEFQHDQVTRKGPTGVSNETLAAILIDRLEKFPDSKERTSALVLLESALQNMAAITVPILVPNEEEDV